MSFLLLDQSVVVKEYLKLKHGFYMLIKRKDYTQVCKQENWILLRD